MRVIGPYRVIEEIARGGMGAIYRAVGPDRQQVALKLLLGHRASNPRARARFLLEAKTLSRLRHPNVVAIHQVGEFEGAPWLALEFIAGESLEDRLRRGPLPIHVAVRVAQQLAQALRYVHGCGVLHRDLKPANVLLHGERALLTDFGLSQDEDASQGGVTRSGVSLGTPGYWAPEQAQGVRAAYGPHTDLYGLGAVLYACLTGRPPVQAVSLQDYLEAAQVQTARPPRAVRAEVPQWLSALCMRCLSLAPEDRPASADDVARELVLGERGAQAPSRARGLVLGILVALVCVLVGVGAWLLKGDEVVDASPTEVASEDPPLAVHQPAEQPLTADDDSARLAKAEVLLAEARALLAGGRQEEALEPLARAEELAELREAYEVHCGVLGMLGRYPEAIAVSERALARYPDHGPFFLSRGLAKFQLHQVEEALVDLDRAAQLSPRNVVAALFRGKSLAQLRRYREAAAAYDSALAIDPRYVDAYVNRAQVRTALRDLGGAASDCDRALELDPNHAEAYVNRGVVQLELGRPQAAIDDYTRALALKPRVPDTYLNRAIALASMGRNSEAVADCDRAIAINDRDPEFFLARGVAKEALGEFGAAIADYDRALAVNPRAHSAYFNRGLAQHRLDNFAEAVVDYTRVIELAPSSSGAFINRGLARHALGELQAAVSDYDQALRMSLDPQLEETVRGYRADALAERGR